MIIITLMICITIIIIISSSSTTTTTIIIHIMNFVIIDIIIIIVMIIISISVMIVIIIVIITRDCGGRVLPAAEAIPAPLLDMCWSCGAIRSGQMSEDGAQAEPRDISRGPKVAFSGGLGLVARSVRARRLESGGSRGVHPGQGKARGGKARIFSPATRGHVLRQPRRARRRPHPLPQALQGPPGDLKTHSPARLSLPRTFMVGGGASPRRSSISKE